MKTWWSFWLKPLFEFVFLKTAVWKYFWPNILKLSARDDSSQAESSTTNSPKNILRLKICSCVICKSVHLLAALLRTEGIHVIEYISKVTGRVSHSSSSFQGRSLQSERKMFYSETLCSDILETVRSVDVWSSINAVMDLPRMSIPSYFQFPHDNSAWDMGPQQAGITGKEEFWQKSPWPWLNRGGKDGQRKWRVRR